MSTILIVDDESEMVYVLKEFFILNGFKVFIASGGKKALSILELNKTIDLMILDIHMPEMTGIEVLEKLKKRDSPVQVVVLTGSLNFTHFVEKVYFMGYSEKNIFFKPVKLEALLQHINKLLKEPS